MLGTCPRTNDWDGHEMPLLNWLRWCIRIGTTSGDRRRPTSLPGQRRRGLRPRVRGIRRTVRRAITRVLDCRLLPTQTVETPLRQRPVRALAGTRIHPFRIRGPPMPQHRQSPQERVPLSPVQPQSPSPNHIGREPTRLAVCRSVPDGSTPTRMRRWQERLEGRPETRQPMRQPLPPSDDRQPAACAMLFAPRPTSIHTSGTPDR